MAFGKEVVDGERPFMAKVSCPKLKERLCWQPSLLPVFSWAQTLPYSEENPSSYVKFPVLCSTSRGKYWWGILYVLLWLERVPTIWWRLSMVKSIIPWTDDDTNAGHWKAAPMMCKAQSRFKSQSSFKYFSKCMTALWRRLSYCFVENLLYNFLWRDSTQTWVRPIIIIIYQNVWTQK